MIDLDRVWHAPSPTPVLSNNDVHIWRASLKQPPARVHHLLQILSQDEQSKAERFRFERDRRRFIASHGTLRAILGRYLGVGPGQLQFSHGTYGKPVLVETSHKGTLCFNMARSHELALYAVSRDREVGVDLEYVRPFPDAERIVERFFSAPEHIAFQTVPMELRHEAFFTCWVRKEAYVKARGNGLSLPLNRFEVSLVPGEPAKLQSTSHNPQEVSRWSLHDVTPGPGYVAAVAVQGQSPQLKCWQWA